MRFSFRSKGSGWFNEQYRHSLAARGIRTSFKSQLKIKDRSGGELLIDQMPKREPPQVKFIGPDEKKIEQQEIRHPRGPIQFQGEEYVPLTRYTAAAEVAKKEEEYARKPFDDFLGRMQQGYFGEWSQWKDVDAYRKRMMVNAAFDGANLLVSRGIKPDFSALRSIGISGFQIRQLKASLAEKVGPGGAIAMGLPGPVVVKGAAQAVGAAGEVVGAAVSGVEAEAEAGFKRTLAAGAEAFERAPESLELLPPGGSTAFGPIDRAQPKVRLDQFGDEVVETPGMLNPLAVGELDKYLKRREKANEMKLLRMKESEKVDYLVNDIFSGKTNLAKADFKPFKEGLTSYKNGDIEGMAKAIFDLESENFSLKHRISLVDNIRNQMLSSKNVTQVMLKGKEDSRQFFFNPIFGPGTGSEAWVNQTDKMSRTMFEVQKSSNAVAQRIAELKRKYNKLRQLGELDNKLPERPVKIFQERKPTWMENIELGRGLFKAENPIFKGNINVILHDDVGKEEPESIEMEEE